MIDTTASLVIRDNIFTSQSELVIDVTTHSVTLNASVSIPVVSLVIMHLTVIFIMSYTTTSSVEQSAESSN